LAVCTDVLEPRHDEYYEALRQLSGYSQYTLLVRYERDAVLHELLAHNPEAVRLREEIVGTSPEVTRSQRAQLEEIVDTVMESSKPAEAGPILEQLGDVASRMSLRREREADDVVEIALLVRDDALTRLTSLVSSLATANADHLRFQLVGPQAPHDFVEMEPFSGHFDAPSLGCADR
ncbi:MAG: GvpL/GvpF family gas vesicle protein, partial [Kocuria sp.]|nr:GvpL/GvpF family gas vesicle protein [Kocuria sp.]